MLPLLWLALSVSPSPNLPLVELFTSEGCSSCPPADGVLRSLDAAGGVIALEFHVDYWDRLGWKDPFSMALWSERQLGYADRLAQGQSYTPQMVVDGRVEFVGSNPDRARQAVSTASGRARVRVEISVSAGSLHVTLGESPVGAEVFLALAERDLRTEVPRGENAGRSLRHGPVVRSLRRLGQVGASVAFEAPFAPDPAWKRKNLVAVAFVQAGAGGPILGAARLEDLR